MLHNIKSLPAYQKLIEHIKNGDAKQPGFAGLGLMRGCRLPVLAAIYQDLSVPLVFISNRADRALTFMDEMGFWLPEAQRLFFPEPNPLFYEKSAWNKNTANDRIHALTQLSTYLIPGLTRPATPPVIVTTVRALMALTIPRREFIRNTKSLKTGQTIQPDELLRYWVGLGYEHSHIVVEPGQFSRRGGIIDIWSSGETSPARLELFGDEIDTLRAFDPATQRTIESLKQITVTPAREIMPLIAANTPLASQAVTEFNIPQVYAQKGSLLDYLTESALIMLDGQEFLSASVNEIEEEALQNRAEAIETGIIDENFPVPYLTWSEIEDAFTNKNVIELGYTNAPEAPPLAAAFEPAPRFAGKLKDLIQFLAKIQMSQLPWQIVSRQSMRLKELWQEQPWRTNEADAGTQFIEGTLSDGFILHQTDGRQFYCLTDSEIFGWSRPQPRRRYRPTAEAPETFYADLQPGDWVVHVDYGIGKYTGLVRKVLEGVTREYLTIAYQHDEQLFVPIHQADRLTRYVGSDSRTPGATHLGGQEWQHTKQKVRQAVQEVAADLLDLYATRQVVKGYAFKPDTQWQEELEASFPYIETDDQLAAIQAVKRDMEAERPMDRLLCGDVGYGKTEVTLRAAFKAVMDQKQVAVLVPTTVLAQQHYDTFRKRMAVFPVEVEMLSRFRKPKEQDVIIKRLREGKIDIIIGTHRLISSDVAFKDLGLVVIDEEQRFGVTHKEHLKQLRTSVDVLTLTATPIPRTLYMALTGVRDISTINTPPEERLPIVTHVGPYDTKLVRAAIIRELERGGQVFFVHNRVQTIEAMYMHLSTLVPEARIGIGHGQMPENELAKVMENFTEAEIDILLCTSIIESGLDIPNANTLIVDRADTFGLAQLYQLRGRVGRGAQRAYAYLFRHSSHSASPEGEERLEVLAENTQLGAGYAIAMRDLEMRGAGELLGMRQSGYIGSVGFHLYTQLLAQAVRQLRQATGQAIPESSPLFSEAPNMPVNVELPISIGIPVDYIQDQNLRLRLYRRLASIKTEEEIASLAMEFADRFGTLPDEIENLFYQLKVKLRAQKIGLAAVAYETDQIELRYPPLPAGIQARPLPYFSPLVRSGKNSYWVMPSRTDQPWQVVLLDVLGQLAAAKK